MERTDYVYDVFISHAVEDKLPITNELYRLLKEQGLSVWYSGTELGVGDRLTDSIQKNLDKCRFGVVIISPTYLSKIWALTEFFLLLTREKNGQKVILPVLYDISPEQLASKSTLMAEIFAVRADKGLDHVAEVLAKEIRKHREQERVKKENTRPVSIPKKGWVAVVLLVLMTIGGYGFLQFYHVGPQKEIIEQSIQKRITKLQQKADLELKQTIQESNARSITPAVVEKAYADFSTSKSYYRNEYTLNTGLGTIRSKRNVETALGLDMDTMSPLNLYTFSSPDIYSCDSILSSPNREARYLFSNTQSVKFDVNKSERVDDHYQVKVSYSNPIRLVVTKLVFPSSSTDTKRYQVIITGFRAIEIYSFIRHDDAWILTSIE